MCLVVWFALHTITSSLFWWAHLLLDISSNTWSPLLRLSWSWALLVSAHLGEDEPPPRRSVRDPPLARHGRPPRDLLATKLHERLLLWANSIVTELRERPYTTRCATSHCRCRAGKTSPSSAVDHPPPPPPIAVYPGRLARTVAAAGAGAPRAEATPRVVKGSVARGRRW